MKFDFRFHVRLLVALALVGGSVAAAFAQAPGAISRGPYVQMATPDSIYIVWRTQGAISPVVRFGATPRHLDGTVESGAIRIRRMPGPGESPEPSSLHSAPAGTVQYEAHVTGLKPDSRYYYAVCDGEKVLAGGDERHFFRTHPVIGTPRSMRFWVVGDSGIGSTAQMGVYAAMLNRTARDQRPLDFYLHVGDMAYVYGADDEFQKFFFEAYAPTLRNVVCWPSIGNHEGTYSWSVTGVGPYYDAYVVPTRGEAGGLASGTEAYYSFVYGNAHFICVNSHDIDRSPSGAMARWLKADLEQARSDWLIAFFHHPPYTRGSHDSDIAYQQIEMRRDIMPILEGGGVDVVFSGHSHIYERSMLMDGAYATPTVAENVILDDGDGDPDGDGAYRKSAGLHPHEGTVQVVTGHGGIGVARRGTMPVMKKIVLEHGSVIVDLQGDTLRAMMINKDGETRDVFSVVKRGMVRPVRLKNPWQPPEGERGSVPANPPGYVPPPIDLDAL